MEILLLIRLVIAAIFGVAAVGKFLDLEGSEKAVKDFGVPEDLAKPFSIALPVAELIIAVLLLPVSTAWFGAVGAFLLLLIFIAGMLWQMAKGNAPDCHCFGQIHSEPVSAKSLLRNAVFALLAFVLVLQGNENQGASIFDSGNSNSEGNFMSLILGLATVGLLAAAVFYLKKISEQQTQIMRRIEVLELTGAAGGREIEAEALPNSFGGLVVGSPAPDFVLPDISGKRLSFESFLAQGKPTLFFFVSATCTPCEKLLPEIETWQNELKDKVNFVFVSKGKAEENLKKFGDLNFKQILLQEDQEVSELFGAQWTPTAILINEDGIVASRAAAGDKAIRELIEKIKAEIDQTDLLLISSTNGDGHHASLLGKTLPEFSLPTILDKNITPKDLQGKKTLVTFWSLDCGFCQQLIEDLREWENTKGADEPDLLLISQGDEEKNRELNLKSLIAIDNKREISARLGMEGTPSAILVNEEGKIVSETAAGAPQIWALLGKRK